MLKIDHSVAHCNTPINLLINSLTSCKNLTIGNCFYKLIRCAYSKLLYNQSDINCISKDYLSLILSSPAKLFANPVT